MAFHTQTTSTLESPGASSPELAQRDFKFRRILVLGLLLTAIAAMVSFHPADLDYYAGGLGPGAVSHNHLGAIGTYFGWFMLVTLGLSSYLLLALALLCSLRRLIWRGKLRRSSPGYFLAIPLFSFGISLMLGLDPNAFSRLTSALNISQMPGGVVGHLFCAPSSGWLFVMLNYTGCFLIAISITLVSLGIIWLHDWSELARSLSQYLQRNRASDEPSPNENAARPPAGAPSESPLEQSQISSEASCASPILTRPRPGGFQGRRAGGQASAPSSPLPSHPTYDPVAPKPSLQQPDLPVMQPTPPPPPTPAVTPPPPSSNGPYTLPPIGLFKPPENLNQITSAAEIESRIQTIQRTLDDFNIDAEVINAIPGPQITLFEIQMGIGVRPEELGKIESTLLMNLKVKTIRLLLPIPGRDCSGVEVPNQTRITVTAYELFSSPQWQNNRMDIPLMLGKNISGDPIIIDLADLPHLLVAGSTGSGKSVTMNLMILSILLHFRPDELKLIMFDPKYLEFAPYSTIPHMLTPIINEPEQVGLVLRWAVNEMNRRYRQLKAVAHLAKNLLEFNRLPPRDEVIYDETGEPVPDKLPFIVIIIDELADIMARAQKEVDTLLAQLAGKARAAGIHLIIATQRPDSKVITGVVKSNFICRIALQVTDLINSRVILDQKGAEKLLGKGDMLYKGKLNIERLQSGYASNAEISSVVQFCSAQGAPEFDPSIEAALTAQEDAKEGGNDGIGGDKAEGGIEGDDLVSRALDVLALTKKPTISNLQRRLTIGYNKAASLMEELEDLGYVGPQPPSGMREIYWDAFPTHGSSSFARNDSGEDLDSPE